MTNSQLSSSEAAQELLRRRQARSSLLSFTTYTKPDYEVNWHHERLCDALDRFVARDTRRLMIFEPPRTGKSELVSRRLPAYILGRSPDAKIIGASYGSQLAEDMCRDVKGIITGDEYARLFPDTRLARAGERIPGAINKADIFTVVNRAGAYRGAGVRGPITGRGFDYGIIDDPVKDRKDADSPTERQNIKNWYSSTFFTRQEKDACILITLTRWHQDDLAGWLLKLARENQLADQWTVIEFPAIKENPPSEYDPREPGEPLWPNKYPLPVLHTMQATMVPRDWFALQQQKPAVDGGTIILREWYEGGRGRFDASDRGLINRCIARYISIDTAQKDKEDNDFTAFLVAELLPDYRLVVRYVKAAKVQFPALVSEITRQATRWNADGKLRGILIEDKNHGTAAIQTLNAQAEDWLKQLLIAWSPLVDKEERARLTSPWCCNGSVLLPHPSDAVPFLADFEEQLFTFPGADHDDQVDAFTQLVIYLENYVAAGFHARNGTSG